MNNEKVLSNSELLNITGGAKFIIPSQPKRPIDDKITWPPIFSYDPGVKNNKHLITPVITPQYGVFPIHEELLY